MTAMREILRRLFNIGPIRYGIAYKSYTQSGKAIIECNSVIFINLGTSIVTIDEQLVIQPNQSFSVPGELFEYMEQTFNIAFSTGGGFLLCVIKEYK